MATTSVWRVEQWSDVFHDSTTCDERGARPAALLVDQTVSEVGGAVRLDDLCHGHESCRSSWVMHRTLLAGNCVAVNSAAGRSGAL